jgi:CRP-like cAMP-binding protein
MIDNVLTPRKEIRTFLKMTRHAATSGRGNGWIIAGPGHEPAMSDVLTRFPLVLSALPRELVTALRPHAIMLRAKAGRTLVAPDSRSLDVYWVALGRVQVALISAAGQEVILRDLRAGDMFGEMAPIDGQPRSATIIALDDCVLISVPGAVFRQSVFAIPAAAEWLARLLVARIRDLTTKVFELNALRVPSRLHCELLRLCGAHAAEDEVVVIDPSPTHADLASRIGTHREAVTRELRFLADHGIIHQDRRRLTVVDLPGLARLVRLAAGHTDGVEGPPRAGGAVA